MNPIAWTIHRLIDTYRRGFTLPILATLIFLFAFATEFAQHAVEIGIGFFDSAEAARELGDDPLRLQFGAVKVFGLMLAWLAGARFWWTWHHGGSWWRIGSINWINLLIAVVAIIVSSLPLYLINPAYDDAMFWPLQIFTVLVQIPLFYMFLGALFGDTKMSLKFAFTRTWRRAPIMILLLIAAYAPGFYLHYYLHEWAFAASIAMVWVLMFIDAVVVGLMGTLVASALYLGYDMRDNATEKAPVTL